VTLLWEGRYAFEAHLCVSDTYTALLSSSDISSCALVDQGTGFSLPACRILGYTHVGVLSGLTNSVGMPAVFICNPHISVSTYSI
jgi:hypothetical protein